MLEGRHMAALAEGEGVEPFRQPQGLPVLGRPEATNPILRGASITSREKDLNLSHVAREA